uniref:CUB domain-containing protein n=1 Tax=Panagrolaimus sp. ES5 TaxID=591445 RepID=A0AC34GVW3_9BILA
MTYDSSITYLDGANQWEHCNPYVARTVAGSSGLVISHHGYGTTPYNESKNCVIMVVAPLGYQIRLKILDFNVPGISSKCDKDSLHILDHEKPIDVNKLPQTSDSERTPGPIIGNFCGFLGNKNSTLISTHNSLTVWWHTDPSMAIKNDDSGFRLLWSAFRKPTSNDPCNDEDEFQCKNGECIPSALACNRFADCEDSSDLDKKRQVAHNCQNVSTDLFSELDGPSKFLMCVFIGFLILIIVTAVCFILCYLIPRERKPLRVGLKTTDIPTSPLNNYRSNTNNISVNNTKIPPVPSFSPPSHYPQTSFQFQQQQHQHHLPPNFNPNPVHGHFMCANDQITNTTTTTKCSSNPSGGGMYKLGENYPTFSGFESSYIIPPPPATPAPSDYTYIRTDANRVII